MKLIRVLLPLVFLLVFSVPAYSGTVMGVEAFKYKGVNFDTGAAFKREGSTVIIDGVNLGKKYDIEVGYKIIPGLTTSSIRKIAPYIYQVSAMVDDKLQTIERQLLINENDAVMLISGDYFTQSIAEPVAFIEKNLKIKMKKIDDKNYLYDDKTTLDILVQKIRHDQCRIIVTDKKLYNDAVKRGEVRVKNLKK